jgi:hypothetical protein
MCERNREANQVDQEVFVELVHRFRETDDPDEVRRLGDQLGCLIFGI